MKHWELIADMLKNRGCSLGYDPDRILQRVAEKYQVDRERLVVRGERGLHGKNVAAWMNIGGGK